MKEINIPEDLYEKLVERVERDESYGNVEDFVIYLLQQLLTSELEEAKDEEEEEEIKKRLKKLGYL